MNAVPPTLAVDPTSAVSGYTLPAVRREALGLFLRHLAAGERVARDAADGQLAIAVDARDRRFLRAQVRQETVHATLFDGFARALGAASFDRDPRPYRDYAASVAGIVAAGAYDESVVATQLILEALGEAMLARLDNGLSRHGDRLRALRRTIRRQEAAHHRRGRDFVAGWTEASVPARIRQCARRHRALATAMIASGEEAMHPFGVAPVDLEADLDARLPAWVRSAA